MNSYGSPASDGDLPDTDVFREVGGMNELFPTPAQHLVDRQARELGPLGVQVVH